MSETVQGYVERTHTVPVTIEAPIHTLECLRDVVTALRWMGCKARQRGCTWIIEALIPYSKMGDVMEDMADGFGWKD